MKVDEQPSNELFDDGEVRDQLKRKHQKLIEHLSKKAWIVRNHRLHERQTH